ncbi:MAG: sigma-70 family RNA polymerase sigma factor [Kiritimatiellae bacterium]|nr:sigma-70 family RNA polymerase sigma factor [Kiritimatiellia bacterium]
MQQDDRAFLEEYVRDKSEGAFQEMVRRYSGLVYSSAYRSLQDHHLAEDASQATFILLARKAHTIRKTEMLASWLWQAARNVARNMLRERARRLRREATAELQEPADADSAWQQLAPELDAALAGLPVRTRVPLIGHFLAGKTQRQLGEELGVHVLTVRNRIQKGLAQLRKALTARGILVPSALLGTLLAERTAEAVTAGMAGAMCRVGYGALTGATPAGAPPYVLAKGVMRMMAWTKAKTTMGYAGAALLLVAGGAAMATGFRNGDYRMPDEPRYARVEYPPELLAAPAGYILDFYPDSWLKHDLSGTWKLKVFQADKGSREEADQGLAQRFYSPAVRVEGWQDIPVPYSLGEHPATSPNRTKFRGVAWYRHAFGLPADWARPLADGWRVLLRLEAIGSRDTAEAWLNGRRLGESDKPFDGVHAFEFDVTDITKPGADNTLAVRIVGGGSHRHESGRTGLWQPVRLVCVPPIRAREVLVATPIDPPALQIKAEFVNHASATQLPVQAVLTPYRNGQPGAQTVALETTPLQPGRTSATYRIRTPGVRLWTPDDPNLYLLTLRSGAVELARVRIGFRTFEAKNGDFTLNGNKIKLNGVQFSYPKNLRAPGGWGCNRDNHARKHLYGLRQAHINFARPHVGEGALGGMPATLYNLCDEFGFLIYDEYPHARAMLYDPEKLTAWGQNYAAWIRQVHNHASCVMWDFGGNELYSTDSELIPVLNYLYAVLEGTDLQHRPKTSSSGRLTYERLERFPELEKVDFADSHRYNGFNFGSYQEWIDIFPRHDRAAKKRYGPNTPTLNCEWGFPGDLGRYRASTAKIRDLYEKDPWGKAEKRQWIEWATSDVADIGGYMQSKGNWAGSRLWTTDPLGLWERSAEFARRFFEVYRRAGDVIDGGHFNSPTFTLLVHGGGGHEGLHAAEKWMNVKRPFEPAKGEFFKTPGFYVWRRVYNPVFVCLDIHDRNTFAGHLWTNTVHIMNDSPTDAGPARAVLQVLAPNGEPLHQECVWQGHLQPYGRLTVPVQLSLSSAWPTGRYALELYLLDTRDAHLSDNSYPLDLVGRADLQRAIRPVGRVGLYEPAPGAEERPAVTTAAILRSLSIPYRAVGDFAALKELDVLIIGRNALDTDLAKAGASIGEWVRTGGRLLCFEQSKAGQFPFLPEVKVKTGARATFTELLVPKHPAFHGLTQANFDDWNAQQGLLFHNALEPLNEGMLAVGPWTRGRGTDRLKMILASYAVGKGEMVLSQYEITRRYGKDSVATRLTQNLLAYIVSQPRSTLSLPFESTAAAKRRIELETSQAHHIDLSPAANARLEEFHDLPAGVTTLAGDVPFAILEPARGNANCCIALRGRQQPDAPLRTGPIPVGRKLAGLYLLHYATWAAEVPAREVICTLQVTFANGAEHAVPLRNGIEIGDWWQATDLPRAQIVFTEGSKNLFLTEIPLPQPNTPVDSIAFESAGNATPVILAVTGKTAG